MAFSAKFLFAEESRVADMSKNCVLKTNHRALPRRGFWLPCSPSALIRGCYLLY
jgi:hypothetical protein